MDVIQEPRSIRKNLARLAVPIFIETLLIMMLGAVDTVMLSQYSDNSVAAVGVVNQLIMFAFLIFEVDQYRNFRSVRNIWEQECTRIWCRWWEYH